MKFLLSPDLFAHRRGRFLASLLDVELLIDAVLPESGFVLISGESIQDDIDKQRAYLSWAEQSACTLLVLPPYSEGRLFTGLDWSIGFSASQSAAVNIDTLAGVLAAETVYKLDGNDGGSELSEGHFWSDHSCHTRYWKVHANSGLLAATTLPLWSISLMNHAELMTAFLEWFSKQTGKVSSVMSGAAAQEQKPVLLPQDTSILISCYGMKVSTAAQLAVRFKHISFPFLNLAEFDLDDCIERLISHGLLDSHGVTELGLEHLQTSPYWPFAKALRGADQ